MKPFKLLSRLFAVFGVVMMFAVSGWGDPSNNPIVSLSCSPNPITEGTSGTTNVTCTVNINVAPNKGELKLKIKTTNGTATTADSDYQSLSQNFSFTEGTSPSAQNFTVKVVGDTSIEPNETFTVSVTDNGTSSSQNFTLPSNNTITITNDDDLSCSSLQASDNLTSAHTSYSNSSHYNQSDWNVGPSATSGTLARAYKFSVNGAGSVAINLTRIDNSQAKFSVAQGSCPTTLDGLTTSTQTMSGAGDIYVYIYYVAGSNNNIEHQLDVVFTPSVVNIAPTANAGTDQSVTAGANVTLNGNGSSDSDGSISSYSWKEGVTSLSTSVSFSKSDFSVGTHTITLTVTDNGGLTNTDTVVITVNAAANIVPTANAGADQSVTAGANVTLNGNGSSDSDGTISSYSWKEGTTSLSTSVSFSKSDFSVGTHTITLTVTDNSGATNTDTVVITVNASGTVTKPYAQCGLFSSVLTSYDKIVTGGNNIQVCSETVLSYPSSTPTPTIACNASGCGSGSCSRIDPPADRYTATFPPLPSTFLDITTDTVYTPNQTYSDGTVNEYRVFGDVRVSGNSGRTITFAPGDYYFNTLVFPDNNAKIAVSGDGLVRIFVKSDMTLDKNVYEINTGGTPDQLFIYVGGNLTLASSGGGNGGLQAYFYVKESTTFEGNSQWSLTGGITSEGPIQINGQNPDFIAYSGGAGGGYGDCNVKVGFDRQVYQTSEDTTLPYDESSQVTLTVKLSHTVSYPVTVSYRTYDGTNANPVNNAIATSSGGTDYYSQNSLLTFAAGEISKDINISIIHDEPIEPDENFTVVLTNPKPSATVQLDTNSTATVTILGQTTAPVCYADNFDSGTAIGNSWRVLKSSGTYTPDYVNGRMQLTDNNTYRATAITKDYQFRASQNLIIAEFTHYAYGGGNGADGIAMVLYDSAIGANPTVGAFGGSLGYAQKCQNGVAGCSSDCTVAGGCPGFQGGWLGLGIDEYGNYSNPSEGRLGTGTNSGAHADSVAIRGSASGSSPYTFLAGSGTLTSSIDSGSTSTSSPLPGDKFRMTVDGRDPAHLFITLERKLTTGSYQTVINKFDAVASQGASPAYVRLALTGSTGASNNIHEIDDLTVSGICVPYTTETTAGVFDAWDTSRSVSDRNISTNIASQNFNLTIASLNSANNGVQAKGSGRGAYYRLWDSIANTNRTPYAFFDANASASIQPAFNLATATKDMKVEFKFCADYNGTAYDVKQDITCTSQNICHPTLVTTNTPCYREKFSTDNFAIRPDHFEFSAPIANMRSGEDYNLTLDAKDYSGANTQEYNQSISSLTKVPSIWWQRDSNTQLNTITYPVHGSIVAAAGDWNLSNGTGSVPIQFSDVGKFTLDLNDTNWAAVDIDDTALSLRTIHGEGNVTFIPWDFNITAAMITNNKGVFPSFTYLSNDLNMSARIPMSVSAKNKQHVTTQNYANNMYERNITITPFISSVAANTAGLTPLVLAISNMDANFTAGTKSIAYNDAIVSRFNFNRNQTQAISPFDINSSNGIGNDVNLTIIDTDSVYGDKNQTLDGNATFVYGRIIPRDIRVFGNTADAIANGWYEVYNAPTLAATALSPSRNDAMWYINKLHNDTIDGDANVTYLDSTAQTIGTVAGTDGMEDYNFGHANAAPYSAKAHINTESWLWYGATALPYSDPSGANLNCLTHPCFNISIVPPIGASGSAKDTSSSTTKTSKQTTKTPGLIYDYAPATR
ncbi:MAG: PKD domain-containing protein [Campylobacterales bacterium]|nr:PKD domain-containing protein [Campylobacterales bacterium]